MTTQSITLGTLNKHASAAATATATAKPRFFFVDNLRILLTILVVLHHLSITYGHGGGWYYLEGQPDDLTSILLTMFNAINQAFFMGFFFMLSGYFTPGSYERKGAGLFLKDRFLRLGIPLLVYMVIIEPLLVYALGVNTHGLAGSLWSDMTRYLTGQYLANLRFGSGPLWFVETLLIFVVIYALWRRLIMPALPVPPQREEKAPGNLAIALFALALGLVSFIVRIWLPIGWNFDLLNLQLPFFPQYIALFVLGLLAYRRQWFMGITEAAGKLWLKITIALLLILPVMFIIGGAEDTTPFLGGGHWQSLLYSLWEQFLCMGLIITLLVWFRRRFNHQGGLVKAVSASAYTVYIIHALVIVLVALAWRDVSLYPLLKFPVVAVVAVPLCVLLAYVVRRLPLARDIL